MIVDTSALIAVLFAEEEAADFAELMAAQPARVSATNWVEATMVADGKRVAAGDRLDRLMGELGVTIEPVTETHARAARIAFRRYGRGSGSPARLNFGDCFAYALSATSGEPLLFKGVDFTHTDVLRAR
ncbi:type II toxin-antitoxin system VapC family toxin [Pimelobacter simplex]|uniref:type II toxin-antitoxin system VapC family toxin n=1 Tax=Nocardioides simplex TaxID=2045 RepID=UPI00381E7EEF